MLIHTTMPYTHTTVVLHKKMPQSLLGTDIFTHTQTEAFTQRDFYTQTLLHRRLYTDAFTHRHFLNTKFFTNRRFYTQTPLLT